MPRVFKTKGFERFSSREGIPDEYLKEAAKRADEGYAEVSYGGFLFKVRIARVGAGKSGGYRSLLCVRQGERAFFMHGFPKSAKSNIDQKEEQVYKKLSKKLLSLSEEQIKVLIEFGDIIEIN